MQYLVVSFSHKKADIALREKLSFSQSAGEEFLSDLLRSDIIKEVILLSTCNRTELIMIIDVASGTYEALRECFSKLLDISQVSHDELSSSADIFEGYSAIHHIFLVASSLDSLIVGETQISGQLKKAYRLSLNNNFCTLKGLGNVLDSAFKCASHVRNATGISKRPISIASVAVFVANNLQLTHKKAAVIGLGEMGQLVIKHLLNANFDVVLLNHNHAKALEFRDSLQNSRLSVLDFNDLELAVNEFECIFSATASSVPIITNDMIKKVDFKRHFFDIALPRDIEDLRGDDINVRCIDDLRCIVDENMGHRKDDIDIACDIVSKQVSEFFKRLNILAVEPIIKILRALAKDAALGEVQKAIAKGHLPKEYEKNIAKTMHNAFNVFLHNPTKNLKNISSTAQISEIERVLKILFSLENEDFQEIEEKHDICELRGAK